MNGFKNSSPSAWFPEKEASCKRMWMSFCAKPLVNALVAAAPGHCHCHWTPKLGSVAKNPES